MASPHLNLNFCHNVSAHNCLPSELPEDVSGVRAHKPVEKILRAYCRGAELDLNEVESLQLGRCWCNSSNPTQTSTLIDSKQSVESAGFRSGDYVFVKRISSEVLKVEEERSGEWECKEMGQRASISDEHYSCPISLLSDGNGSRTDLNHSE